MGFVAGPGGSLAISMTSGGKTFAYNNISDVTLRTVAVKNPSRQRITFHNPGNHDIYIAPKYIQNTGSDVLFTPANNALGGCFRVFAQGGSLEFTGECQNEWQAIAISGAGVDNPLTVMESNI